MPCNNFNEILSKYREIAFSERDKGTRFERLMKAYLQTDPKYSATLKNVWLWEDFFARNEFGGSDTGIDLIAETIDGSFWAIQCKCFQENATIDKPQLDTFLSTSGRTFKNQNGTQTTFALRVWISTTERWSSNAENTLRGQTIPVIRINISDLQNAPVDWGKLEAGVHGDSARLAKHAIRPHQETALQATCEYFKHATRGKLIMACGTGKTFTSLKIAEKEATGFVLVLVPSIALVGQILREWTANSENPINSICVCSDPRVSQSRKQNSFDNDNGFSTIDLTFPATTNPSQVISQYKKFDNNNLTVIFSTYQSIEVIEQAQKIGLPEFGLIICDEAHRTTGVTISGEDESAFVRVHNNNFIKSKKRLYMTATPRLYDEPSKAKAKLNEAVLCSMDDPDLYGEEIHRIGFGEAVEKGLLSDYKVLIFTVSDKDIPASFQRAISNETELPADTGAKIAGCINALSKQVWGTGSETLMQADPEPMHRAVAFCQSIANSRAITRLFNDLTQQYIDALPEDRRGKMVSISSNHIDGTMNAPKRDELLTWLKSDSSERQSCKILSNVRCLSEGVDVPALDAVMFLSARNSQVDVVQSVGRVMRKASNKKYGYIIIPVLIPSDVEPDKALDDNDRYKVIWSVLNALRAHDDRFNATINKIDLNKKRPDNIVIGGTAFEFGDETSEGTSEQMKMDGFEELQNVIYARLVQKVGTRRYWEQWAQSVAQIAEKQIDKITAVVEMGDSKKIFDDFLKEMRLSIDKSITKDRAIEMLAQHIITAPIFNALFEKYAFAENNAVSVAMGQILNDLRNTWQVDGDIDELTKFYDYVKRTATGLDDTGRQQVIIELYNNFFKFAFPKMTEMLGIVYTPVEIVDFIIHSVNDVLQAEFGRKLTDEKVNILDPFTGTGTFITRLIQSGLISKKDLPRKYEKELFANELVLLAYYIACVNIENSYHDALNSDEYKAFEGIALTDTFQAYEDNQTLTRLLGENSKRVRRQNKAPLTVIFGNPPYSVGQKSANDDAQNNDYPRLDVAIENSYVKLSTAVLKKSLYDSYIRAFRYATDRLGDNDGIICYVSNGGWLDGNSTDGFRKSLEKEFSKIYIFNLRGNARTSGEQRRKEKGNVFGEGTRTPITITLLVKRNGHKGKAKTYYKDIGDYLDREEKLAIIKDYKTFLDANIEMVNLAPSENGDWITERNDIFKTLIPLSSDKAYDKKSQSVFVVNSMGYITSRDSWLYNYSSTALLGKVKDMIDFYNLSLEHGIPKTLDPTLISWGRGLANYFTANKRIEFDNRRIVATSFRPFVKQWLYNGEKVIECRYKMDTLFPVPNCENLIICVSGIGVTKDFSLLITDKYADYEFTGKSQCFPLYYYERVESSGQPTLFDILDDKPIDIKYVRHDGVSDFILGQARTRYGNAVKKEDVFFYVYGLLHSPKYRTTFANDLKKSLPHIPLVEKADDFWAFSQAGRELTKLHLEYESAPPCDTVTVTGNRSKLHVEKMRFRAKDCKDTIIFNSHITIENIPLEAYEYIVNGKSAIEWVMERYQVKTDKDSGIINDPNLYADECGKPSYILDLLLSIITVSFKTQKIVAGLPDISFE